MSHEFVKVVGHNAIQTHEFAVHIIQDFNLRWLAGKQDGNTSRKRLDDVDVLELARVIGQRDLRRLMIYYQADADELADRL